LPANTIVVGYARTKMDDTEYKKRVSSYIKPIGPEQEKKLKEFLVSPLPLHNSLFEDYKLIDVVGIVFLRFWTV